VLRQLFFALPLLIDICIGLPVKERASSSKPPSSSTSNATLRTKMITHNTPYDIETKFREAGVHSKLDGTQLHKMIEPIIPIRRKNRGQTDHAIQHLHKIGVDPQAIERFKKHRTSGKGKGIYRGKEYPSAGKGRTKFDRHIGKIDFNTRPQEAARQWWSLGVVGRTERFAQ
jgi:hypothetical protein